MSVSKVPVQPGSAPPPARPEEAAPAPPRDAEYSPRLREAEELVGAPEWQAPRAERLRPREGAEERGGPQLFPSDPRAAFVLLNEARYLAIQGVFGVRRDQVNLMTVIAALTLAEAAHQRAERLRRGLRGPTRGDAVLADGLLNALGGEIVGPFARDTPFFGALIGAAAVGAVATRVLRQSSRDIKVASRRVKLSVKRLLGPQGDLIRRRARSS
jgi:hypothetical protein